MTSTDDLELNTVLLSHLECPICLDHCTPPIFSCNNGHHTCAKCRKFVRFCGVCRDPGRPSHRNLFAEKISTVVKLPCVNAVEGCTAILNSSDMNTHFVACSLKYMCNCRIFICSGMERTMCFWEGKKSELLEHVEKTHPHLLSKREVTPFPWALGPNENTRVVMISVHGELFWSVFTYNHFKKKLCTYVRYIGDEAVAKLYNYKIYFRVSGAGESYLCTLSERVRSIDEAMLTGRRYKHQIGGGYLKWFLTNGVVMGNVRITKVGNKPNVSDCYVK